MATLYGSNYTKAYISVPSQKTDVGDGGGKVHSSYDSFEFVDAVNGIGDKVMMMKLPINARILFINVKSVSFGTTGIFKIIKEENSVLTDMVTGLDAGGQVVSSTTLVLGDKLSYESQIYLELTEATDAADGDKVEVEVLYIMA